MLLWMGIVRRRDQGQVDSVHQQESMAAVTTHFGVMTCISSSRPGKGAGSKDTTWMASTCSLSLGMVRLRIWGIGPAVSVRSCRRRIVYVAAGSGCKMTDNAAGDKTLQP
jgi:hypothetical protein